MSRKREFKLTYPAQFADGVAWRGLLWQDARMATEKKKLSKFDRVALEVAEGIANIPIEGKKEALDLLHEIESKKEAPERTKKISTKIKEEVKKKSPHKKNKQRKV